MTDVIGSPQPGVSSSIASIGGASVRLEGLVRTYGKLRALDGLTLSIEPGEFIAFLGPSGCGKTTALRVLAGFERPDSGRVLVDGKDVSNVSAQKRDMGMVFQSYSLFPNMSVVDNVAFGLRMRRQSGAQRRAKAGELLELVGLGDQSIKYPHQLSGGQQQRVALARALAIEPRVLLLDEPLSALDAKVRAELRDQIRSLQQRLEITTVFVTHDQEEALSMADRVCVMSSGHIEQVASPDTLYARPTTAFVAQFVGISSRVPVQSDGKEVVIFGQRCLVRSGGTTVSGPADALLRPEDVAVEVDPQGDGFITHKSFFGAITRLVVQVGEIPVRVDVRSDAGADMALGLHVRPSIIARDVLVASRTAIEIPSED